MNLEQELLKKLLALRAQRKLSHIAKASGVDQGNLTRVLDHGQKLGIDKVSKILEAMQAKIIFPDDEEYTASKDVCFVSPKIVHSGSSLPPPDSEPYLAVPLTNEAGAGPGIMSKSEFKSWILVHREMPSISRRSNLIAVEIAKNARSMIPLLYPGDIVLVDLNDWGQDSRYDTSGNIFLVREPGQEGGGKVKRVTMSGKGETSTLVYYSENVQENVPEAFNLQQDFDGDIRKAIVGKIVWAWTDLSRK